VDFGSVNDAVTSVDDAAVTSCNGLAATCGPSGDLPCCSSPIVTGGTFARGYDLATDMMYPTNTHVATIPTFRLDRYEVTVGRFRQFVAAGMGTQLSPPTTGAGAHRAIANSGWDATWNANLAATTAALTAAVKCDATYQTWTDAPAGNEARPMGCITWYEAMAFCAWDGGFLPTETEWDYVARAGSQQRAYPWSNPAGSTAIDCTQANYGGQSFPSSACVSAGASNVGKTSPAGDGLWGQSDLGGNVWEWVLDWYAPYADPCDDCANLTPATFRVFRGGGYDNKDTEVRSGVRNYFNATYRASHLGVRCARDR
jgi:formylglycine-generating enzyme required for sulfatase activity